MQVFVRLKGGRVILEEVEVLRLSKTRLIEEGVMNSGEISGVNSKVWQRGRAREK